MSGIGVVKIYFQPGADIRVANAQVTAVAQSATRQMPQGTTPPLILNYNASTVPIIQLALSGKGLSEQNLADLVNKGDETLENLFPPKDEQPEWATFDEDDVDSGSAAGDGERRTEGRFALFTSGEPETSEDGEPSTPRRASIIRIATCAVDAPVAMLRVYCSCPGVSAMMNLRLSVEK